MFVKALLVLASGLSLAAASPLHAYRNATGLPAKTIFQFNETGTWLENLAVRPNGDLLMTMLTPNASLWTLKRPYSAHPEASLVHTFSGATGLNGITETSPDTFVLLSAQYSGVGEPVPGTFAVWEVSFRSPSSSSSSSSSSPSVRKVTDFPEAQLANGIASVPSCESSSSSSSSDAVLVGDSFAGSLWRVDTRTGAREPLVEKAPAMSAPAGGALPIGINGLKVRAGYAYWSNSAQVALYRTRIDGHGYLASASSSSSSSSAAAAANGTAAAETVATLDSPFVDDFAFDNRGLLWAATNGDSSKVDVVRADGSVETAAVGGASEDTVAGGSAVAFGRTAWDRDVLYVTTSGTLPDNRTEPAKVVAVNRAGFR
ncbi:26S proteasome complex subunit [Hypoxylon texense]